MNIRGLLSLFCIFALLCANVKGNSSMRRRREGRSLTGPIKHTTIVNSPYIDNPIEPGLTFGVKPKPHSDLFGFIFWMLFGIIVIIYR